uniref:Uncharacterized protein n=1 Tax=Anser cygnoides TaxID=8845 RepID=A0A8B9IGY1_ANSCY
MEQVTPHLHLHGIQGSLKSSPPGTAQVVTEWRILAGSCGINTCIILVVSSVVSPCTGRGWKCCPEGWRRFQESCYYFSADQMPWDESQQNCSGMGSHLVVINTEAEQVSAGLREGQSSLETGVPGLEGISSISK